ncbi:MAG: 2,4-dihydroxyhept-2-ene-1,7-dioic acid aldolase [Nitrospirae bacterium]|nr:2,4-dihydroxyhept-2-ene-1,7-dioic acid aldolase [Nitrospirota bacterium]
MKNTLKQKLHNKTLTIGSWITIGNTTVAEIMAKAGFDWLTIDIEHSSITFDQTQQLIQVIELAGVTPLVRVGENSSYIIKRVMDSGAHGVIVPMVNTKEDAQYAVDCVKYPPVGKRGVGLARAQGYGFGFEEYKRFDREDSIIIVLIEHIDAVKNIEEILSVDGIDAFIIGPYDLSASMGMPGEFNHPEVKKELQKVIEFSKTYKRSSGFHVVPPDPTLVTKKIDEGYRFIGFGLDTLFLGTSCREGLKFIRGKK